jgi:hypothetical protein
VDLYSGSAATGSPAQSVVAARDGSGAFAAHFDPVGGGTYTAVARQRDAAGNTGSSAPVSFTVGQAAARPPDFAALALDESLVDAGAGRVTALSSCDGSCSRTALLTTSARTATRLRLAHSGSRPVRLGSATKAAGAGGVRVRMSRRVRRALKRSSGAKATFATASGAVSLKRAIALRPVLSGSRLTRRGLKLAGICSARCTMSARLVASATTARRLGIRSGGRSVKVASGRMSAGPAAQTFTLRVSRAARRALPHAKHASLKLQVTVTRAGTATRRATRRITVG